MGRNSFSDILVTLRSRAALRQRDLAQFMSVSRKTIQKYEQGLMHPSLKNLQQIILFCLEHHLFLDGQEETEAEHLWNLALWSRNIPFDRQWFRALIAHSVSQKNKHIIVQIVLDPSQGTQGGDQHDLLLLLQQQIAQKRTNENYSTSKREQMGTTERMNHIILLDKNCSQGR